MNVAGGIAPSVLDTLEFPAALARVAEHAAGPLGAARVRARRPGTDPEPIRDALAQVAELAALLLTDDAIRATPVPDITPTLELLAIPGSVLEGVALADVAVFLVAARGVNTELSRLTTAAPRTAALKAEPLPKTLEQRLVPAIGPDGTVLDGASLELARARKAVREARNRLVALLEKILGGLDARDRAADAGVTVRENRYVIPVRSTSQARVGGIVHDESATRATVFIEPPEAIELGNELRARESAEQREVLRVLRELTDLLRPHVGALAASLEMCVAFDDLCARARYAALVNGFVPVIGTGALAIRDGRHPLLLGGDLVVVAFDLTLAGDEWTILVSGPNTGGKTVLIKAVGLLCLMAQSGIVPPLGPQSALPVFSSMFADIGDRQSIAESLSTFSAHTRALREILDDADAGSLVLLDEVGSGTDPAEGAALAAATLRALTRRHAITLATTHLGALKQLAAETVGIVNASLQFETETLTPTYRLLKGVPGRSYGLAIARRLGLPADVLADAERSVPDSDRNLDRLLASVEAGRKELERREVELTAARDALVADQEAVERRGEDVVHRENVVKGRERALDADARERARVYLLEARKTVERALAQARAAVDEVTAKEARRLVEEAIEKTGETGNVKRETWLSLDDLRRQRGGAIPTPPATDRESFRASRFTFPDSRSSAPAVVTEISLRGLRADEAEGELLRAIDAAVLADAPFLRIIHGKGTGALRDLVQRTLASDPRVAHFDVAPANQGGTGATIAEFRA